MKRKIFYLGTTLIWSGCTCASDVTIAPPRVPEGGRAVSIAVNQSNQKNLIVATESGGLFRTFDGGISFQHLDAFPTYAPVDVAFASLNPNVVVATARDDFRTTSGGGIWRSADGGASWSRPSGWPPASSASCSSRPAASGISHMPLSTTFYVATDCGIAVSTDNGATFSMVVLDSAHATVRAVLVVNRSTGVAADDNRLWFLRDGSWQPVNGGPAGSTVAIHALASPWWANASIFYFVGNDRQLYFSMDAGASWTQTTSPQHDPNRELFVRVARGLDHDPTHLDLYFGNGTDLFRQAVTVSVPGGSNAWQTLVVDHPDPADVAFSPGFEIPILLATDGGVHLTPDNGATWKLTGGGYGGFTALQIGEVTGRFVAESPSHLDLYYGTQDNGFRGSLDGGHSWGATFGNEGAFISADAANPSHVASPIALRNCGIVCVFDLAKPTFDATSLFPNAPDGNTQNADDPPFEIVEDAYVQDVPATGPPLAFNFFLTTTLGASWSSSFSLPFRPQGRVQFAGSLANPAIYTGVRRSGSIIGLYSAQNIAGQATVRPADSTGLGSLGLLLTAQARYAVFGVDPANANHLLAADVGDSTMKASTDGGASWFALPALTTAVTDSGRFLAVKDIASFATTIAWDPTNSCHILVGTMQNGVIRSADGGLTWHRVAGSAVATYVSSFFFPPSGAIWMSAYGRGLWTLGVDRRPPKGGRCTFARQPGGHPRPDTLIVVPVGALQARAFSGLSDTLVCSSCTLVGVRNGRITDVVTDGARVSGVAISAGMVEARDRTGKEVSLTVPNSYTSAESDRLRRLAGGQLTAGRRVRGLVLRGDQLVALVLARDAMPLPPSRTPLLYVASAGRSRVPSVATVGDSITVFGYGFLGGNGASGVDVVVGSDTVARGLRVGGDGTFTVHFRVSREPGVLVVTAVQRDGKRVTVERGDIEIVARDVLK